MLFHRSYGTGPRSLVILHGLLGSSRNWHSMARRLSDELSVHSIDLRNHGESPHEDSQSFEAMCGDVIEWLDAQALRSVMILGHSMGGKVAMRLACRHAERVAKLIVLDIAPRAYSFHSTELDAMIEMNLERIASRTDADRLLSERIANVQARQFLLMNLRREENGRFTWRIDLEALRREMPRLRCSSLEIGDRYDGPTLLIRGGLSDYVHDEDEALFRSHFSDLRFITIDGAGHNAHVETPDEFERELHDFLQEVDPS